MYVRFGALQLMIRKQLYIDSAQQEKLRRIADRKGCTEAAVLREAIDRLPEFPDPVEQRLIEAGLLVQPRKREREISAEEMSVLEKEYYDWVNALPEPLGLSEIVIEDRR